MISAADAEKQLNELIAKQDVTATINEFKSRIEVELELEKVVLFGSRARGDNDIDSDIDIAVIVSNPPASHEEKRLLSKKLLKVTFDIELKTGLVINPIILGAAEFNKTASESELIKNIRHDGVEIR
ncbi:nucleotidyltransferase domain-containing protein (plasmid) [Pseudomonas silesiensis]|uniref:nucleotidyltransferase domain-containing protein n=1 Tax=Pseudomonas silesiensis TaxID=1853130 RepID=UPI0030D14505